MSYTKSVINKATAEFRYGAFKGIVKESHNDLFVKRLVGILTKLKFSVKVNTPDAYVDIDVIGDIPGLPKEHSQFLSKIRINNVVFGNYKTILDDEEILHITLKVQDTVKTASRRTYSKILETFSGIGIPVTLELVLRRMCDGCTKTTFQILLLTVFNAIATRLQGIVATYSFSDRTWLESIYVSKEGKRFDYDTSRERYLNILEDYSNSFFVFSRTNTHILNIIYTDNDKYKIDSEHVLSARKFGISTSAFNTPEMYDVLDWYASEKSVTLDYLDILHRITQMYLPAKSLTVNELRHDIVMKNGALGSLTNGYYKSGRANRVGAEIFKEKYVDAASGVFKNIGIVKYIIKDIFSNKAHSFLKNQRYREFLENSVSHTIKQSSKVGASVDIFSMNFRIWLGISLIPIFFPGAVIAYQGTFPVVDTDTYFIARRKIKVELVDIRNKSTIGLDNMYCCPRLLTLSQLI